MSKDPREDSTSRSRVVSAGEARITRAFRISLVAFVLIGATIAGIIFLPRLFAPAEEQVVETVVEAPRQRERPPEVQIPEVRFTDITETAGIDFIHVNGAYGDKLLPETMGGGVAFLDYDSDGDQDLLFVNSTYWPEHRPANASTPTMALYRNDGHGSFTNVTAKSGLAREFYGMGVAVGDVDNDGDDDLFITAVGENHLFRNEQGRFTEVSGEAGVGGGADAWSTSAAFLDYDNDGDLDLFVANYVKWSRDIDLEINFQLTGIGRAYGPPTTFEGSYPYLYRNDGDWRFTDVSAGSGVQVSNPATGQPMAKSLGVAPIDIDRDGFMDLFVANDTVQNFFFHNQGDGSFAEEGVTVGVAFDRNGSATGAMGADVARYRNDEEVGLAVGNFANEMTSLYVTQGDPSQFADEAIGDGVGPASRKALSFGLFFFDYDLDGREDLFEANGHLEQEINVVQPSQHYAQPPQLFWNCGPECPTTFLEVPPATTGALATPVVGRGASYADIDGDGDLDIVITQVGRRPLLLRNDQRLDHHWLRVLPVGHQANRDAIGSVVELQTGDTGQWRQVLPTRSYLSQVQRAVSFGLGPNTHVDALRIHWPGGDVEEVQVPALDQELIVEQQP